MNPVGGAAGASALPLGLLTWPWRCCGWGAGWDQVGVAPCAAHVPRRRPVAAPSSLTSLRTTPHPPDPARVAVSSGMSEIRPLRTRPIDSEFTPHPTSSHRIAEGAGRLSQRSQGGGPGAAGAGGHEQRRPPGALGSLGTSIPSSALDPISTSAPPGTLGSLGTSIPSSALDPISTSAPPGTLGSLSTSIPFSDLDPAAFPAPHMPRNRVEPLTCSRRS
jgi:hypothetical protein